MFGSTRDFDAAEAGRSPGRPLRLLVTGIDGGVGCNLADRFARRANVIGLYRDHPVTLPECQVDRWEEPRPGAVARLIRETRPHWIIHCGPFARGSWDLAEHSPCAREERAVCRALADASQRTGAQLTVISTDVVFAGPRMFHDEQSPATSRHPFARAAIAVERTLAASGALVVRTHAYGWSAREEDLSFAERVWLALAEGVPCPTNPHACATPILAADLAEMLWLAYRRELSGLYHIAGAERISACRFADELASLAGLSVANVPTQPGLPASSAAEDLQETSLNTRRAHRDLAHPMPMLREGLIRFVAQIQDGTRARLQGRTRNSARPAAA
jgi:dTDP-4-dehydrorhamnose reductase